MRITTEVTYTSVMTDVERAIGARMLKAAAAAGLSRDALRRRVDVVSTRQVDRYLDGQSKVPAHVVAKAAAVTDVSADYILGLIDEIRPIKRPAAAPPSAEDGGHPLDELPGTDEPRSEPGSAER